MVRVVRPLTSVPPFSALLLALTSPGQAQSTKLAGPFAPGPGGGDVRELRVSPDATRVVYRADEDAFEVFELYAAPADGSVPAVKLNGALAENGDVIEGAFAFSPDGARVVYLADQDADDVTKLYSVPSDGSAAPLKLNPPLPLGGDVDGYAGHRGFEFSPDGTRVIYAAEQTIDSQPELWSVPLDGSAAPVKLNGSVFSFAPPGFFISSQERVVFRGSSPANGFEILSAPLDGSSAPLVLSQFTSLPSVGVIGLTSDGSQALYGSTQSSPQDHRIWIAPVDGSTRHCPLGAA
jgi:Tol biopolymer transport system component